MTPLSGIGTFDYRKEFFYTLSQKIEKEQKNETEARGGYILTFTTQSAMQNPSP